MDTYELKQAFLDIDKERFQESFYRCKYCPSRILAYFKVYDIEDIEHLTDYEFKESKERLLDDLDMNIKQDLVNMLSN